MDADFTVARRPIAIPPRRRTALIPSMARKKKSAQTDATPPANGSAKKVAGEPSTSALIICRNKYVSAEAHHWQAYWRPSLTRRC